MEKVVTCSSSSSFFSSDIKEVNKYLEEGWTVKSVTMAANSDYINVVFVLEKK